MRKITILSVLVAMMAMLFGQIASAQDGEQPRNRGQRGAAQQEQQGRGQRGAQRGGLRGGRGISMIGLVAIESVQSEIEMVDDQVKEFEALLEKLRSDRGTQTRGGQTDDENSEDMTEEEIQEQREERRTRATAQAAANEKTAVKGLKNILLDHQYARLHEIYVQALGIAALQDETIAKELMITEKQKTAMQEASDKAREAAMEEFGKLRESGDREAIQKRMSEIRNETESKVLGVLTAKQKASFEEMKGEAFEIPAEALRGQRRGRRGGGQRGGN